MRMTRTMMLEVLKAGLHQDGVVEGAQGAGGGRETRGQECLHPDRDHHRSAVAYPGGWAPLLSRASSTCRDLGRLLLDALNDRDYPVVAGINLVFGTAVMGINLMIDLIYAFLDPRVRYE